MLESIPYRAQDELYGKELSSAHHYLSLRSCLAGLRLMVERLFDVTMEPQVLYTLSTRWPRP